MIRDLAQTGLKDRVITPGPSGIILPPGFTDARVTVAGVSFNTAKVLEDTTIAGTPGAMPENGPLNFTPSASTQTGPAGHTTGVTVSGVTFNTAKVLNDTTIAGTRGTMPENGAVGGTITTQGGTLTVPAGHTTGGIFKASLIVSAGNSVIAEDTTFTQITANVYTKASLRFTTAYGGSVRIAFSMKSNTGNSTNCYGKVYKNGSAIGTERVTNSTSYVVYTEDFTCNVGDYFEVWGYGISGGSYMNCNDVKIMISTASMVTIS